MTATLPHSASDTSAGTFVLRDVSWRTYECLLRDYIDRSAPRFTYDQGMLEIMSPSLQHEKYNRRLADLVKAVAEVWEIDAEDSGSTTFRSSQSNRGFEPNSSFYIQHLDDILGNRDIDLENGDPPPDLVIEVEQSNSALQKLPIFASLSVPEVWRVSPEGRVSILRLDEGSYAPLIESIALPGLDTAVLTRFLASSNSLTLIAWLREIRVWAAEAKTNRDLA